MDTNKHWSKLLYDFSLVCKPYIKLLRQFKSPTDVWDAYKKNPHLFNGLCHDTEVIGVITGVLSYACPTGLDRIEAEQKIALQIEEALKIFAKDAGVLYDTRLDYFAIKIDHPFVHEEDCWVDINQKTKDILVHQALISCIPDIQIALEAVGLWPLTEEALLNARNRRFNSRK